MEALVTILVKLDVPNMEDAAIIAEALKELIRDRYNKFVVADLTPVNFDIESISTKVEKV